MGGKVPAKLLDATGETEGHVLTVQADGSVAAQTAAGGGGGYELIEGKYQASGTSLTITVPADTLTVDGHHLYIEALFEDAGSNTPRLSWDGTSFGGASPMDPGERAMIQGWIHRTGASAQLLFAAYSNLGFQLAASSTDTATLSGTVDIVAYWDVAGSNIVKSLKVWKVIL